MVEVGPAFQADGATAAAVGGRGGRRVELLRVMAIAVPVLLQLVMLAWLPRDVFWVTDEGNRFIQVQSLLRGRVAPPAVEYPGRALDPSLRFLPDGGVHFLRRNGAVVPLYPPYFAWLAAPLVAVLGIWGLYVVPLAAAAGCLVLFGVVLGELGVHRWRWLGVLTLGLGSPLLFYGLTFWEHTLMLLLALAGLALLLVGMRRERVGAVLLAGVALGLATVLREEGYILVVAVVAATLVAWRRVRPALLIAAGWLAVVVPLWLVQVRLYGSWLGLHASLYEHLEHGSGLLGRAVEELRDAWFYLLRLNPDGYLAVVLVLPLVVAAVGPRRWRRVALWAAVAAAAAAAALVIVEPDPVWGVVDTQGLLLHVPLLVVVAAFARRLWRAGAPARFALLATAGYAGLAVVPLHRQAVGLVWGPRHFLVVIPLIIGLALLVGESTCAAARRRELRAVVVALVVVSVVLQLDGLRVLAMKKEAGARLLGTLRASGQTAVVSDVYWLAEEAAALYFTRPFFFVYTDRDLARLLPVLEAHGVHRVVVVLGSSFRKLSAGARSALRERATVDEAVRPPGTELMDVDVLEVPLDPAGDGRRPGRASNP